MTPEGKLLREIRLELGSKDDLVLFRNQAGSVKVDGRWQTYGLVKGASDLIGILTVPKGKELVGVFFACEVKSATGRLTKEQAEFIALVNRSCGFAFVARSVEDALKGYLDAGGRY